MTTTGGWSCRGAGELRVSLALVVSVYLGGKDGHHTVREDKMVTKDTMEGKISCSPRQDRWCGGGAVSVEDVLDFPVSFGAQLHVQLVRVVTRRR